MSVPSLRVFVSDRGYIFREGEEDIQHVIADPPEGLAWTEKRTMDEPTASLPGSERQKPTKQKPEKPIQYWTQCVFTHVALSWRVLTVGGRRCTIIRPPVSLDIEVRKQLGQALNPDGTFDQWVYCPYTFQADIHQVETASGSRMRPPKYAVKRLEHSWITHKMKCQFRRDNNTYTVSRLAAVSTKKPSTTSQRRTVKVVAPVSQRLQQFVCGRHAERWSVMAVVDTSKVPWLGEEPSDWPHDPTRTILSHEARIVLSFSDPYMIPD
ncbi:hypothetical protein C8R47DRAFT_1127331 [Mycena vitilis]|nr:hypothetical protein C8R47DRAFT_1127331 [Mycena vitilis]